MKVCRIHLLKAGIFREYSNASHFFGLEWIDRAYLVVDRDLKITRSGFRREFRKAPVVNLNVTSTTVINFLWTRTLQRQL